MDLPSPALVRFHLQVGARLALRVLAPVVAFACGAAGFFEKDFLRNLSTTLFTGGSSGLLVAAAALGVAGTAAPRVCRGLSGWVRHLPASGVAHRRAATLAVAVAQFPIWAGLAGLASLAVVGRAALATVILGLAGTTLAAAVATVPARRSLVTRALALPAAALTAAATCCRSRRASSSSSPRMPSPARSAELASAGPSASPREGSARLFEARIARRALGWKLGEAYVVALLPVGAAPPSVANNRAELPPRYVLLAAILGGGVSLVLFLAQIGEALAARRPAWPWLRSLPGSAAERVRRDALFLTAHALPLLAGAAWISPRALLPLAGALPFSLPSPPAPSAGPRSAVPARRERSFFKGGSPRPSSPSSPGWRSSSSP